MKKEKAVPLKHQCLMGAFVVIPFIALIVGVIPLWGFGIDMVSLGLFLGFFYLTTIGVTVGFHRCFTHLGFSIRKRWLVYALGISGSMAAEGPLFHWVGWHRRHHQHTDVEGDPHSPHLHDGDMWSCLKGMLHAHVGWLFVTPPDNELIKKMKEDPILVRINQLFIPSLIAGLILPPLIGIALRQSVAWVHVDFLWGGLIRMFFAHHVTWCVNSVCHLWGSRPFETGDESTNNIAIAPLASGEGYHNCHHAHPRSARHGLLQGQIDISWYVIRGLEKLGLITDIYVPDEARIKNRLKPRAL